MDIAVYSRDGCVFCNKVKDALDLYNLNYDEYMLGNDFNREYFIDTFGENSSFPRVVIDGNVVGGYTDTVNYLNSNVKLVSSSNE